jgi:hypothetical protein
MKANIILITLILSTSIASAFGATAPFFENNPLFLAPGDKEKVPILLQNMAGDEDITLIAEVRSGNEIAKLTDQSTQYYVPLGRRDVKANLEISIPNNAKPGSNYEVSVFFRNVAEDDEGNMVQLSGSVITSFNVIVEEEEILIAPKREPRGGAPKDIDKVKGPGNAIFTGILILFLAGITILGRMVYRARKNQNPTNTTTAPNY